MLNLFLIVLGLVIGSFLGALTYRLPRNVSINKGRSVCPNCNHQIAWFDNIPLISYILLFGRCRNCHEKISIRYPLIELATAIIFLVIGPNIFDLILASILIIIFLIDLENQLIFDEFVFAGFAVFILKVFYFNTPLFPNLLAGFLSALLLLVLNLITKGRGMGLGDVKLAILLGALAGLNLFLIWLFFSFLLGAIVGIILIIIKSGTLKQKIAFGPFLILGYVSVLFFGRTFLNILGF
jgi:prepilin signal peptidase PulO-like enzyme (type II secretory pathway)